MAEFALGGVLLPAPEMSDPALLLERIRSRMRSLREWEDRKDRYILGQLRDVTGVNLIPVLDAQQETALVGNAVGQLEATIADLLLTSKTSSGADLQPGQRPDGTYPARDAATGATAAVGGNVKPTPVTMLPMWKADP